MKPSVEELSRLEVNERLQLIDALWESLAGASDSLPVTDAEKEELDRRRDEFEKNPGVGSTWEEVRARLRGARP